MFADGWNFFIFRRISRKSARKSSRIDSSGSWSRELGTLGAPMNNGEEGRKGGGKKQRDGDERRRERGSDVHLTGGGVPPLDLSRLAALAVPSSPPPYPASLSFSPCFTPIPFFFLLPLYPASHSNTLFRADDLTEIGGRGGALITAQMKFSKRLSFGYKFQFSSLK